MTTPYSKAYNERFFGALIADPPPADFLIMFAFNEPPVEIVAHEFLSRQDFANRALALEANLNEQRYPDPAERMMARYDEAGAPNPIRIPQGPYPAELLVNLLVHSPEIAIAKPPFSTGYVDEGEMESGHDGEFHFDDEPTSRQTEADPLTVLRFLRGQRDDRRDDRHDYND